MQHCIALALLDSTGAGQRETLWNLGRAWQWVTMYLKQEGSGGSSLRFKKI